MNRSLAWVSLLTLVSKVGASTYLPPCADELDARLFEFAEGYAERLNTPQGQEALWALYSLAIPSTEPGSRQWLDLGQLRHAAPEHFTTEEMDQLSEMAWALGFEVPLLLIASGPDGWTALAHEPDWRVSANPLITLRGNLVPVFDARGFKETVWARSIPTPSELTLTYADDAIAARGRVGWTKSEPVPTLPAPQIDSGCNPLTIDGPCDGNSGDPPPPLPTHEIWLDFLQLWDNHEPWIPGECDPAEVYMVSVIHQKRRRSGYSWVNYDQTDSQESGCDPFGGGYNLGTRIYRDTRAVGGDQIRLEFWEDDSFLRGDDDFIDLFDGVQLGSGNDGDTGDITDLDVRYEVILP